MWRSRSVALLLFFFLLCTAAPGLGQRFSAGVKGGVPLSSYFTTGDNFSSKTNRYTVGPVVEVRLPHRFGVEFNALYKRLHFDHRFGSFSASGTSFEISGKTTANRWEFPLLVKYHTTERMFVSTGASLARLSSPEERERYCSRSLLFDPVWRCGDRIGTPFRLEHRNTAGVVAGAGYVMLRAGLVRLVPEFRYTRWTRAQFRDEFSDFGSNRNQWEFLLGMLF